MAIAVHGLAARQGETQHAFVVLRMREPTARARLVEILRYIAPLLPNVDGLVSVPRDLAPVVMYAVPWEPPEAGHAVDAQRRLIESAGAVGVATAWFHQVGTCLRTSGGPDDTRQRRAPTDDVWADDDSLGADDLTDVQRAALDPIDFDDLASAAGEIGTGTHRRATTVSSSDEDDDAADGNRGDAAGDADDATWSHGPPPRAAHAQFPIDGEPAPDADSFGIALKLAGPALPGEASVLAAFHQLWLAPYGGRFRSAGIAYDAARHAVHLWIDRFAVPCAVEERVQQLLSIAARIDELIPVVRGRFRGVAEPLVAGEPFVLGGNPLVEVHALGGERAVAEWIASQREWSPREIARMLVDIAAGATDEARASRDITAHAGEIVLARARAGKLDARAVAALARIAAKDADSRRRALAAEAVASCRDDKPS